MIQANGYAAFEVGTKLKAYLFERRDVLENDVQIEILYCGMCHSDLHTVNGEWGRNAYPLVPGHEIVGSIVTVGSHVKKFQVGDHVGVGCFVDSCRRCSSCEDGLQQYCEMGATMTYGSPDPLAPKKDGITQGGYSTQIVVNQDFVLKISSKLALEKTAPLLCAGITMYSPLKHWKVKKGQKVAIAGLGGLGHIGVKLAVAMGAEVTVLSHSLSKKQDAMDLGAHHFVAMSDKASVAKIQKTFHLILNSISASHDYNSYLSLLKRDGTMVLLGLPGPQSVASFLLVPERRSLSGSLIGGIPETQEMLDFCAEHSVGADIELVGLSDVPRALDRLQRGDVKYRFVIDLKR